MRCASTCTGRVRRLPSSSMPDARLATDVRSPIAIGPALLSSALPDLSPNLLAYSRARTPRMLGTTEDPETGQMLYTPRIGRGPKEPKPWQKQGAVGRQTKHTGAALHDSRHEIRAKRTALEQAHARAHNSPTTLRCASRADTFSFHSLPHCQV